MPEALHRNALHPGVVTGRSRDYLDAVIRMLACIIALISGCLASLAAAPSQPKQEAPVEQAYRRLLEEDDKAQKEIDKWILEEGRLRDQGAGIPVSTLELRIEQRRKKVEDAYRSFLFHNPDHVASRLAFGSFLNDQGRESEAAQQWEKARKLAPENPAVWNNLANYHGHNGPIAKAFEYYEKAIELNPKEPVYRHNFAVTVYLFRKDAREYFKTDEDGVFNKSLALYREALKLDPDNFELATDYAQSYYGIRPPRIQDGLKAWTETLKLARDDFEREGVQIHIARFEINAGRFEPAKKRLLSIKDERYAPLVKRVLESLERKKLAAQGVSSEFSAAKE